MPKRPTRLIVPVLLCTLLSACGSRQVQDSLAGATGQQLMTHSIDDLMRQLPEKDFSAHSGARVHIRSHFIQHPSVRLYADRRLALELRRRFDIEVVDRIDDAEMRLEVFYTALGTDQDQRGFFVPVGFLPGVAESAQVDLITLQQFHGIAEMYYYFGPNGTERRSPVLRARTRTDAIGLPIIRIPVSSIDRDGEGADRPD